MRGGHSSIGQELETAAFGILLVTPENCEAPWLLYEAGALSKKLGDKVTPFVLEMKPSELTGPLTAFQATEPTLEDVTRLVRDINSVGELRVAPDRLTTIVKRWWPDLQVQIQQVVNERIAESGPSRSSESMIEEVLSVVRSLNRCLSTPRRSHINPGDTVTLRDPSTDEDRWISMTVDSKVAALLNSGLYLARADISSDGGAELVFNGVVTDENAEALRWASRRAAP